jgi:hypothetical protein
LVISPSEILRRKTIAANRGPGKLPFRRDAFTDFLCAACGSHSALREKADEARGTRADYEQQLPRIDGINFPPSPDTRRGDRRKSRLKHVECGRRASLLALRPSLIAAGGTAGGDERISDRMQIMHPVRTEICRTRPGRPMRSGPCSCFVTN